MPGLPACSWIVCTDRWYLARYFNWFLGTFREHNTFNLIRQRSHEASNDTLMQIETGTYWNALFFHTIFSHINLLPVPLLSFCSFCALCIFLVSLHHVPLSLPIFFLSFLIISRRELYLHLSSFSCLVRLFYYTSFSFFSYKMF